MVSEDEGQCPRSEGPHVRTPVEAETWPQYKARLSHEHRAETDRREGARAPTAGLHQSVPACLRCGQPACLLRGTARESGGGGRWRDQGAVWTEAGGELGRAFSAAETHGVSGATEAAQLHPQAGKRERAAAGHQLFRTEVLYFLSVAIIDRQECA